jgi:signal peptidase II
VARAAARRFDRLALILGGALGNIADRSRFGYVVDFADLHFGDWRPFLVFNVGDAAITIGVLLLLVRALLMRDGKASKKDA